MYDSSSGGSTSDQPWGAPQEEGAGALQARPATPPQQPWSAQATKDRESFALVPVCFIWMSR